MKTVSMFPEHPGENIKAKIHTSLQMMVVGRDDTAQSLFDQIWTQIDQLAEEAGYSKEQVNEAA